MPSVVSARRQVTLAATALMCSVTNVKSLDTLPKTTQTKYLHQEHLAIMTGHIPGCITSTIMGTDHSHNTNPTMTEGPATTEDSNPAPHPTTTTVHAILQLTDAPDATHARTCHTSVTVTHLDHATFHSGVTLGVIPQTENSPVQPLSPNSSKIRCKGNDKTVPKSSNPS